MNGRADDGLLRDGRYSPVREPHTGVTSRAGLAGEDAGSPESGRDLLSRRVGPASTGLVFIFEGKPGRLPVGIAVTADRGFCGGMICAARKAENPGQVRTALSTADVISVNIEAAREPGVIPEGGTASAAMLGTELVFPS